MKKSGILLFAFLSTHIVYGQCGSWKGLSNKEEIEDYHVIYRQAIKTENWDVAFENWEKVFKIAPLADGTRDIQYWDGIDFYKRKYSETTDAAVKTDLTNKILGLYDQLAQCVENNGLPCEGENCKNKKLGFIYGRKAYDMFYFLNQPYAKNLEAIQLAIEKGGLDNEYIIFAPAANIAVYEFKGNRMPKETAVKLYTDLNAIADHQINSNEALSDYFTQAKENMNGTFAQIENDIFDCEYFKEKLQPDYESDPENPDVLRYIIATLKQKQCLETDPFLVQLEEKWKKYAAEVNAQKLAEFEANNPAMVAKKLYDEGKFGEAMQKYDEAISAENDNVKKAQLLFAKASIQFRKQGAYGPARATALEAARLNPGWGRPYMLIGDMYGKSASSCGDSWNQRLAIIAAIDKYAHARAIDNDIDEEASQRIGTYNRSLPDQETGFMRGIKEGQTVSVGCWIGETVRVRYK